MPTAATLPQPSILQRLPSTQPSVQKCTFSDDPDPATNNNSESAVSESTTPHPSPSPPLPGSLLARRRSSAGSKHRPNKQALEIPEFKLASLPPSHPDEIIPVVIGSSAAAETIHSPTKSEAGALTPSKERVLVEKEFQCFKSRLPTPYPERASYLSAEEDGDDGDEPERDDNDEGEDL
ncbi:hypothetical protein MNV49_001870 [Pseudohyphozyma bogoriensis]|nr:hypothetical protein MNV49_001870 [Pseudohyphozyma bogoriensis]